MRQDTACPALTSKKVEPNSSPVLPQQGPSRRPLSSRESDSILDTSVKPSSSERSQRTVNIVRDEEFEFVMDIDVGYGVVFSCTLYQHSDFYQEAGGFCVAHGIPLRKQDGIAKVMENCIAEYFMRQTNENMSITICNELHVPDDLPKTPKTRHSTKKLHFQTKLNASKPMGPDVSQVHHSTKDSQSELKAVKGENPYY